MIKRLPIVITVVALAGGGIASTALAGSDQYAPPTQIAPATHDTQQESARAQNRTAFLDARLAALHAGLQLTPDQEKLWAPVEAALRDFSKVMASLWRPRHDQEDGIDPLARLEKRSDSLLARGQALKKITDAAKPLYATLSDAQKERVPILLRAIGHSFLAEFRHHHHKWRHDEDQRGDEDQGHDKMEQHMRGDRMMNHEDRGDHHEDQDDHDSQDNDND